MLTRNYKLRGKLLIYFEEKIVTGRNVATVTVSWLDIFAGPTKNIANVFLSIASGSGLRVLIYSDLFYSIQRGLWKVLE